MSPKRLSVSIQPAKLLSRRTHQIPGKLLVTELFFSVPLDHSKPDDGEERLKIFCRSARKFEKPAAPKTASDDTDKLPWFVYIPGGPGFGCASPQNLPEFTNEVLATGYQVSPTSDSFLRQRRVFKKFLISSKSLVYVSS
jgi:hypothetical protein